MKMNYSQATRIQLKKGFNAISLIILLISNFYKKNLRQLIIYCKDLVLYQKHRII